MKKFGVLILGVLVGVLSLASCFTLKSLNIKQVYAIETNVAEQTVQDVINYVSLGDSIASGYGLNGHDENKEYGDWDYSTPLLTESYTRKIHSELEKTFGSNNVNTISYACSGEDIGGLLNKVKKDQKVRNSIYGADLITISIGANNVLTPALTHILDFLSADSSMTLDQMLTYLNEGLNEAKVEFPQLLTEINSINSDVQVVFIAPYNPFRGFGINGDVFHKFFTLHLDDILRSALGDWGAGGIIWTLEQCGVDLTPDIGLYERDIIGRYLNIDRVNIMGNVASVYLAGGTTTVNGQTITIQDGGLKGIITSNIENFTNKNFSVADVFDAFNNKSIAPALTDDDEFRSGPGTYRKDKGCVNAWLNQEMGVYSSIQKFYYADWSDAYEDGFSAGVDKAKDIGKDWINTDLFWDNCGEVAWAYLEGLFNGFGLVIEDEIMWAVDVHPTRNGHTVIKDELIKSFELIKFETQCDVDVKVGEISKIGQKIKEPTKPTREGYTFAGWFKEKSCENQWDFAIDCVTEGIILYAGWNINQFNVNFETNGGSLLDDIKVDWKTTVEKPNVPVKDDFIFAGWFTDETLTTAWNFNEEIIESDITLFAKWTQVVCDETLINQYSSNLQNIKLSIAVDADEIKWYVDGIEQENPNANEYVFTPLNNNFGVHHITCEVDGVEANTIEVVLYSDLTSLEIQSEEIDSVNHKFKVINTDLEDVDLTKIYWYQKSNDETKDDILLGTGENVTVPTGDACEIYALYKTSDVEVMSNIVTHKVEVAAHVTTGEVEARPDDLLYVAGVVGGCVILGICVGIGNKVKKSRKKTLLGRILKTRYKK